MQLIIDVNQDILKQLTNHLNGLEDQLGLRSEKSQEEINQMLVDCTHALLQVTQPDKFLKFCQQMGITRNETIEFCAELLHLTVNPSTHFDT